MNMAETGKARTTKARKRPSVRPVPDGGSRESHAPKEATPPAEPDHAGAPVCTVSFCPICLAVTAMQPLRPEVMEHLLLAGRELLIAARAVLDARAAEPDGSAGSVFEKIDIG
jgi:hypothetical protein